ncbi:MAG: GGDEF domain-containing protein [Chromatiaceae bacterium]|nr:GGDEF domain-containing protein [Chromatiaceae bacterium]MCF7995127.1 GGDEF domain-containing protein [Chromatiaceae bacterium]MCF8005169.1 GGDEF domain-containing protein [Chromatiaceae bacterium]MCF8015863.1 GGDEF domain-containing protein [Chromatiaceae bacterium]
MHLKRAGSVDRNGRVNLRLIAKCIRKSDLLGRYGGEEFLLTLPHTKLKDSAQVAEKIRLAVERSSFAQGLKVTVSLGCAERDAPIRSDTFDQLCADADAALYEAKRLGRNRVVSFKRGTE